MVGLLGLLLRFEAVGREQRCPFVRLGGGRGGVPIIGVSSELLYEREQDDEVGKSGEGEESQYPGVLRSARAAMVQTYGLLVELELVAQEEE